MLDGTILGAILANAGTEEQPRSLVEFVKLNNLNVSADRVEVMQEILDHLKDSLDDVGAGGITTISSLIEAVNHGDFTSFQQRILESSFFLLSNTEFDEEYMTTIPLWYLLSKENVSDNFRKAFGNLTGGSMQSRAFG